MTKQQQQFAVKSKDGEWHASAFVPFLKIALAI